MYQSKVYHMYHYVLVSPGEYPCTRIRHITCITMCIMQVLQESIHVPD